MPVKKWCAENGVNLNTFYARISALKKRCENSTRRVKSKMRKIEYVVSDERLITPSGLSLVGQVLGNPDCWTSDGSRSKIATCARSL